MATSPYATAPVGSLYGALESFPSRGQSYVDSTTGPIYTWAELPNSNGSGIYSDTGQVDPSWQSQQNRTQMLALLESQLNKAGGTSGAVSTAQPGAAGSTVSGDFSGTTPYSGAATTAAYSKAKDNAGIALQGALKGLQGIMTSRGISGSGIESQGAVDLLGKANESIAQAGFDAAGKQSDQAFTAQQQGNQLTEQSREFNVGQATNLSEFNTSQLNAPKLALLQSLSSALSAPSLY